MIIGLTGSMGAGKSTTAGLIRKMGWPVFDADEQVHALMENNPEVRQAFVQKMPQAVGKKGINRSVLSRLLAENKIRPVDLEQILYPFLEKEVQAFIKENPLGVLDVPLLFEASWDRFCDKIIFVTAAPDILKVRVFQRPGMTEEKYQVLSSRFWPENEKKAKADYIIHTDFGIEPVWNDLLKIKEELCAKLS